MIPIAFDHPLQQTQVFLVDTHQTILVDHEDTLTITGIEQSWRHRIVRGTVGITAKLFQLFDTPSLQCIRDGGTHTGMILMQVYALQFQLLSVEEESLFSIEGNLTDTCRCQVNIRDLTILST